MKTLKRIYLTVLLALLCNAVSAQTLDTVGAVYTDTIYSGYTTSSCGGGCLYNIPVILPPEFTITDVDASFSYRALGSCQQSQAAYTISLGACKTGCQTCLIGLPGLCLTGESIFDSIKNCLPTPKCNSDTINFVLDFFRGIDSASGCSLSCFNVDLWSISVIGYVDSLSIPKASFSLAQDTTQLHHYIATNLSSGKAPLSYDWGWGDGTHDSTAYPTHTYADSGFYNICLTVTDSAGCMSTFCDSSFHIMRTTDYMIYINVVPPTGINEMELDYHINIYPNPSQGSFTIQSDNIKSNRIDMDIYNVMGEKVYSFVIREEDLRKGYQLRLNSSSGLYLLVLRADDAVMGKKISVLK